MNPEYDSTTLEDQPSHERRRIVAAELIQNRARREAAEAESAAAEQELQELLLKAHRTNLRLSTIATSSGLAKRTIRRMLPATSETDASDVQ